MKIDTNKIPSTGLNISENLNSSSLDLETEEVKFKLPINVSANITKDNNDVAVEGIVNFNIELTCSRCLNVFSFEVSKKFRFDFRIEGREILDLTEDIRQEIILEYPLKPLCKDDCRGLCPLCGQNLNENECECNFG